jgi:hypothetical protein
MRRVLIFLFAFVPLLAFAQRYPENRYGDQTSYYTGGTPLVGDVITSGTNICEAAVTSDVAPGDLIIHSGATYPQGTQTPSTLFLAGGLDEKYITVSDYTVGSTDTVTTTVNASALAALVEGTDFDCITSNAVCATNLAAAMTAQSGISATAVGSVVYLTPDQCPTWGLYTAVADGGADGTFGTSTNGTDGVVSIGEDWRFCFDDDRDTCIFTDTDDSLRINVGSTTRIQVLSSTTTIAHPLNMQNNYIYATANALELGGNVTPSHGDTSGQVVTSGTLEVNGILYADADFVQTGPNGQTSTETYNSEVLTFAASPGDATKTTTGLVPDGAFLDAITTRVLVQGTNCTSFDIGDGADVDIFGAAIALTVGTTTTPADNTANVFNPQWDGGAEVTLTANGGNCFDLSVRVSASYRTFTAPTN